ncbi:hypothetical protein BS47DRAFT_1363517 [Hydnum rufescens UP504]|uniref:Uncharacterized protein n=1 Tax=Hydnum rufescens UP504 TaxID=1448309 RepID=A0A9P6ATW4_9AGAM|nr:hypothetical protein BS47DRAFT_1363517 [Hydnum rufescens UP504]
MHGPFRTEFFWIVESFIRNRAQESDTLVMVWVGLFIQRILDAMEVQEAWDMIPPHDHISLDFVPDVVGGDDLWVSKRRPVSHTDLPLAQGLFLVADVLAYASGVPKPKPHKRGCLTANDAEAVAKAKEDILGIVEALDSQLQLGGPDCVTDAGVAGAGLVGAASGAFAKRRRNESPMANSCPRALRYSTTKEVDEPLRMARGDQIRLEKQTKTIGRSRRETKLRCDTQEPLKRMRGSRIRLGSVEWRLQAKLQCDTQRRNAFLKYKNGETLLGLLWLHEKRWEIISCTILPLLKPPSIKHVARAPFSRVQSCHDHLPTVHPHRWYTTAFGPVPLQLATMIAALLCSNSNHVTVTYRFGKAIIPKAYLSPSSMAVIMENYSNQPHQAVCFRGSDFAKGAHGSKFVHDLHSQHVRQSVQRDTLSLGLLRILARDFIGVQGPIRTNAIFFAWSHDNMTRDSTTPAHTSHYHDSQPVSTSPVRPGQSHSSSLVSMSCEEMRAKISLLMAQLMEKEEEIRVAMRWKEEAEAKLEDIKDVLCQF